jgi:hypothetical protein
LGQLKNLTEPGGEVSGQKRVENLQNSHAHQWFPLFNLGPDAFKIQSGF